MSTPLEQKALLALRQYSLFTQGDRIAVGVSGGADSVALLRFLAVLREEYRWELIVCHIHHGLRGAEADRDEQFVRELAGQLGLPYTVRHIDAAALALENHLSVEEAGRNARYAFFAETAGEGGRIATAHTLDDTIETVLMNLIRGTGLHGLCGIPRTRGNIVRPLLDVTRAEVEEYLALLGQPYCTDSTNLSDDYTRNRVRHDILPRLRELNPNFTGPACCPSGLPSGPLPSSSPRARRSSCRVPPQAAPWIGRAFWPCRSRSATGCCCAYWSSMACPVRPLCWRA